MKRNTVFDVSANKRTSVAPTGRKNKQGVKLSDDVIKEIKEAFEMYDQEGK
jgi:hypothetical protein